MDPYNDVLIIIPDKQKRKELVKNVRNADRNIIGEADNSLDGAKILQKKKPDVVFLSDSLPYDKIKELTQTTQLLSTGEIERRVFICSKNAGKNVVNDWLKAGVEEVFHHIPTSESINRSLFEAGEWWRKQSRATIIHSNGTITQSNYNDAVVQSNGTVTIYKSTIPVHGLKNNDQVVIANRLGEVDTSFKVSEREEKKQYKDDEFIGYTYY